jgi:hypothetical protein
MPSGAQQSRSGQNSEQNRGSDASSGEVEAEFTNDLQISMIGGAFDEVASRLKLVFRGVVAR